MTRFGKLLAAAALGALPLFGIAFPASQVAAQVQEIALVDDFMQWSLSDYEAETGNMVPDFKQAPQFDAEVEGGALPPVAERLPEREDVVVVRPRDSIGAYGGTVRYNATNPTSFGNIGFSSWDPHLTGATTNWEVIFPDLAKSIELAEDQMSATVMLRRGVKWSDGESFTADDIVFFFDSIGAHPDLPPLPGSLVIGGEPTTVEKVDDLTVIFHFPAPNPAFTMTVASSESGLPAAPEHYLRQWHLDFNPEADSLAQEEGYSTWIDAFVAHSSGQTGDMQIDTDLPVLKPWIYSQKDQFGNQYYRRNPYYWKVDTEGNQLPYINEQVRMLVSDPEVVKLNVQSGQLDYADKFTAADLPVLKAGEQSGDYSTLLYPADQGSAFKYQLHLTTNDEVLRDIFNDVRFRQALSVAVNRDEINEAVFFGLGVSRQWGVSSRSPFYEDWMGPYFADYDIEQANALLDEMGLEKGPDGVRMRPDGQPLSIVLYDAINQVRLSELMAEYWTAVGVPTQVNTTTRETFQQAVVAGDVQASVWFADVVSEVNMYTNPIWFRPPYGLDTNPVGGGLPWREWQLSDGAEGEEPPAWHQEQQELVTRWQSTVPASEEYYELGTQVVGNVVEQMIHIGTVGEVPRPYVRSNRLMNFPDEQMIFINHLSGAHSEQWYLID